MDNLLLAFAALYWALAAVFLVVLVRHRKDDRLWWLVAPIIPAVAVLQLVVALGDAPSLPLSFTTPLVLAAVALLNFRDRQRRRQAGCAQTLSSEAISGQTR